MFYNKERQGAGWLLQGQLLPGSLITVRKSHLKCILVTAPNSAPSGSHVKTQLLMVSSELAPALSWLIVQAGNCREKPASPSHPFHCHPPPSLTNPSGPLSRWLLTHHVLFCGKSLRSPEAKEAQKIYVCQWRSLCRLWTRLSKGHLVREMSWGSLGHQLLSCSVTLGK